MSNDIERKAFEKWFKAKGGKLDIPAAPLPDLIKAIAWEGYKAARAQSNRCSECGPVDSGTALYCVKCWEAAQGGDVEPVPIVWINPVNIKRTMIACPGETVEVSAYREGEFTAPLYTHPAPTGGSGEAITVPNEHGKNRYGLDMAYFRSLFNRELNRPLVDFRPDELARVLARAARTADASVLQEQEFQPAPTSGTVPEGLKEAVEALDPEDPMFGIDFQDEMATYNCQYCDFDMEFYGTSWDAERKISHDDDCPVVKLRAMLAAEPTPPPANTGTVATVKAAIDRALEQISGDDKCLWEDGYKTALFRVLHYVEESTLPGADWVRCNERMPKLGQRVILKSQGVIQHYMPVLDEGEEGPFWDFDQDYNPEVNFQYDQWMPLPQPPKDNMQEGE